MIYSKMIFLNILDAFYSLPILVHVLLFVGVALGVVYLLIKSKKPSSKPVVILLVILTMGGLIVLPVSLMLLNNYYWGYGYLHENKVSYFGVSSAHIVIGDYKKSGQSRNQHRVYLVDAQNGKILFKKPIKGQANVKSVSFGDNQLIVKSEGRTQYLSLTGKPQKPINKNQLTVLPELKNGIFKYGYNASSNQVWAINKAGEKYFYNATTLQRESEKITAPASNNIFKTVLPLRETHFTTYKQGSLGYCPLTLKGKIRQQLVLENGQLTKLYFVYGQLQQYFPKAQVVLIQSYQTTDKKELQLTAVNLQGKVLWQKSQKALKVKDFFSYSRLKVSYVVPETFGHDFVILMGGFLLRIDSKTGVMRWKTRL